MQRKETQTSLVLLGDNLKTEKASWNGQEIPSYLGVGRERGLVHEEGGKGTKIEQSMTSHRQNSREK